MSDTDHSSEEEIDLSFSTINSDDAYHIEAVREIILCQFQGTVRAMDPLSLANYSKDKYYAEIGHILRQAINTAVPESVLMNIHAELVNQVTQYIQHHLKRLSCMSLNETSVNQMPISLEELQTTDDSNTNTNQDVFITRVKTLLQNQTFGLVGQSLPRLSMRS